MVLGCGALTGSVSDMSNKLKHVGSRQGKRHGSRLSSIEAEFPYENREPPIRALSFSANKRVSLDLRGKPASLA